MKAFIVYCHPSEDSLTRNLRDEFIKGIERPQQAAVSAIPEAFLSHGEASKSFQNFEHSSYTAFSRL